MSKKTKILLITATALILIGCMIFGGAMTMLKWDFTKLSTVKYETNSHEINEAYKNITIVTDTADVMLVPSESSKSSVLCHEQENAKHSVTVKDGTLSIETVDTRKWYEYIGISLGSSKITVYIPQGEYNVLSVKSSTGNVEIPKDFKFESIDISVSTGHVKNYASATNTVKVKTDTGDISIADVSADMLDLSVSTGKVTVSSVECRGDINIKVSTGRTGLTDVTCKNITSSGSTGNITLKNVIAEDKLSIERSTGHVKFDGSDAGEILVNTDTGDVTGTLLSEKVFIVETDTGSIDVPKAVTGGKCEISTSTGDIRLKLK